MNSIQCPHRNGKRLQGAREHWSNISIIAIRPIKLRTTSPCEFWSWYALIRFHTWHSRSRLETQLLIPEQVGREAIFRQQMCERHRTIEIDHRSARLRCRWLRSSSIFMTGLRAGGPRPIEIGGVIQPCRKASNSSASDSIEVRVGPGGPISATTRSRSVTRTVSPPAASRTYSLSLFFRVLRPTERINGCSYQTLLCQR